MSWPAGTGPGLYKQIVVLQVWHSRLNCRLTMSGFIILLLLNNFVTDNLCPAETLFSEKKIIYKGTIEMVCY